MRSYICKYDLMVEVHLDIYYDKTYSSHKLKTVLKYAKNLIHNIVFYGWIGDLDTIYVV